jgi:hypothetical protein
MSHAPAKQEARAVARTNAAVRTTKCNISNVASFGTQIYIYIATKILPASRNTHSHIVHTAQTLDAHHFFFTDYCPHQPRTSVPVLQPAYRVHSYQPAIPRTIQHIQHVQTHYHYISILGSCIIILYSEILCFLLVYWRL